jgi:hypothetical protein
LRLCGSVIGLLGVLHFAAEDFATSLWDKEGMDRKMHKYLSPQQSIFWDHSISAAEFLFSSSTLREEAFRGWPDTVPPT